jgi:hypothetical protein
MKLTKGSGDQGFTYNKYMGMRGFYYFLKRNHPDAAKRLANLSIHFKPLEKEHKKKQI